MLSNLTYKKIITFIFLLITGFFAHSKNLIINNVSVIDVETGSTKSNQNILIENGIIKKISAQKIVDKEKFLKLDGSGRYLIPGYVDSHVHYFQSGGLYTRPDGLNLKHIKSYEQELNEIKTNLDDTFSRYLASGITSTLDAGGPMWNLEVREKTERLAKSPNVKIAGPLLSTNYHPKGLESNDMAIISVQNFEQARPIITEQINKQVDIIKVWFIRRDKRSLEEHKPLIEKIIKEAHSHNIRVAVHATELDSAKLAVELGADILVHGVRDKLIDDDFTHILIKNEVVYIPTLQVSEGYTRTFTQQHDFTELDYKIANPFVMSSLFDLKVINKDVFPERIQKYLASKPEIKSNVIEFKNLLKLQKAGVIIATGTDAGNIGTLPGSSYFKEVSLMTHAGLSPKEVLKASTVGGAKAMGMSDKIGLVKKGYIADLVLLKDNPLDDTAHLSSISHVIKSGNLFPANKIIKWSPSQIVQRQVNAYNARDIEAFLSTYADNIKIYNMVDGKEVLSYVGKVKMRKLYSSLFERYPELHCEVKSRKKIGDFEIQDFERVTGLNGKTLEANATYTIENNLISKVVFSRK